MPLHPITLALHGQVPSARGLWHPLLLVLPVPPSPLPAVRRTLKSGLSDDLIQALGLGRAPGMEV